MREQNPLNKGFRASRSFDRSLKQSLTRPGATLPRFDCQTCISALRRETIWDQPIFIASVGQPIPHTGGFILSYKRKKPPEIAPRGFFVILQALRLRFAKHQDLVRAAKLKQV